MKGDSSKGNIKVTTMRDHKDLRTLSTDKLFSDLKAYDFEMLSQLEEDDNEKSSALVANQPSTSHKSKDKLNNILSDEKFAMFVKKFLKLMKKNNMKTKESSMTPSRKERNE